MYAPDHTPSTDTALDRAQAWLASEEAMIDGDYDPAWDVQRDVEDQLKDTAAALRAHACRIGDLIERFERLDMDATALTHLRHVLIGLACTTDTPAHLVSASDVLASTEAELSNILPTA